MRIREVNDLLPNLVPSMVLSVLVGFNKTLFHIQPPGEKIKK